MWLVLIIDKASPCLLCISFVSAYHLAVRKALSMIVCNNIKSQKHYDPHSSANQQLSNGGGILPATKHSPTSIWMPEAAAAGVWSAYKGGGPMEGCTAPCHQLVRCTRRRTNE